MINVFVVVVRYQTSLLSSSAFQSVLQCFESYGISPKERLLVYDNSAEPLDKPPPCLYLHNPLNPGIATAYNTAFSYAKERGANWVLLLDQDTEIPQHYFSGLEDDLSSDGVAAMAPIVRSHNQIVSPVEVILGVPFPKFAVFRPGLRESPCLIINSGAFVRVSFLEELGGFNEEFPLDSLDHWWSYEIFRRGYGVWILDRDVKHSLSVSNIASNVSVLRYRSILDSEVLLFLRYRGVVSRLLFSMVLLRRAIKFAFTLKNRAFYQLTLSGIKSVLFNGLWKSNPRRN